MKYMRGKSEEANHNESCMGLAGIDYLGIERVLKRGTGDILERQDRAILVHDRVSGALMLGCEDAEAGAELLERHMNGGRRLIMVSDHALGLAACQQYGFTGMLECYQTAWYGDSPCESDSLALKNAEESDLPMLTVTYDLVSPEELRRIVKRRKLLLGHDRGNPVGFIGEHLEGSMGLLYVFPEYRRQGYAVALEKAMIARTLKEGFIPFGQVEKGNHASLALQKKIGMTVSDNLICWMWK